MKTYGVLVIGCGHIGMQHLLDIYYREDIRIEAVVDTNPVAAEAAARRCGAASWGTDYLPYLKSEKIDIVIIATYASTHLPILRDCLAHHKHVLCEKPFTPTAAEARELIALAKEKHLFLFEAITTAHHPNYALIREQLPALGPVKLAVCTFCQFSSRYPALLAGKVSPVLNHAFAGGALMDINLYNIHFVVGLFGAPEKVHYYPNLHSNGVDTSGTLILEYPGFVCQCVGAKDCAARNSAQIIGENGRMEVTPGSSNCQSLEIALRGQQPQYTVYEENPWYYEVQDIGRILASGDYEACYAALETTLKVVTVLEQARKDASLGF